MNQQILGKGSGPKAKCTYFYKENHFLPEPQFSSNYFSNEKYRCATNVWLLLKYSRDPHIRTCFYKNLKAEISSFEPPK